MNEIEIIDRDSCIKYNNEKIIEFCEKVLKKLSKDNWEFSLLFCKNEYMAELNEKYRNKKGPTDVLTFSDIDSEPDWACTENSDDRYYAGDIVISVDMLKSNAEEFCVDEIEELKRLIIHAILHLNGMDHKTNDKDEEMLILQEDYIKDFGDYLF